VSEQNAVIVIFDISGYTRFVKMHRTSVSHAQQIIADLLESIIDAAGEPLQVNKLEGDAVLLFATTGDDAAGAAERVWTRIKGAFDAFAAKRDGFVSCNMCPCSACTQVTGLRLKAVVHFGSVLFRKIRQFDELAGEPLIVSHRLLKNSAPELQYVMLTDAFSQLCPKAPWPTGRPHVEHDKDLGEIRASVTSIGEEQGAPPRASLLSRLSHTVRFDFAAMARKFTKKKPTFRNMPQ